MPPARRLILAHHRAVGDVVTMTAVVRDLKAHLGADVEVATDTAFADVWKHNPHVVPLPRSGARAGWSRYTLTYGPDLKRVHLDRTHFLTAWHADVKRQTGIAVPCTRPRPDIHLGPDEAAPVVPGRYWLVVAGGKSDFTTKWGVTAYIQRVVDHLAGFGIRCVQAGGSGRRPEHWHPPLTGVVDLVGKTSLREFFRLVAHADGVLCTITAAMHVAAAFEKPCVVWAGGREQPWWEAYHPAYNGFGPATAGLRVPHRFLHTFGLLPCCHTDASACWKNKTVPDGRDKSVCRLPVVTAAGQTAPHCQALVTPEAVLAAVLAYYYEGTIPPPGGAPSMPIPPVGGPTRVVLPDGRAATVTVTLDPPTPAAVATTVTRPAAAPPVLPPPGPPPPARPPAPEYRPAAGPAAGAGPSRPPVRPSRTLDHPRVGGRVTAFVLCYGDYPDMHRRCVDAVLATTPRERLGLRVIGNELCAETRDYLARLAAAGAVEAVYDHSPANRKKYPAMREAFRDPARPVDTKWLLWLDDDTMCDRDPAWLEKLAAVVADSPDPALGMVGPKMVYTATAAQLEWVRAGPWYRGRPPRDARGSPAPNGNKVHFAVGAFWLMKTECVRTCDVPDARLGHNGGDWAVGEQLYQNGYVVADFSPKPAKAVVLWSSVKRRGLSERHPGR